MIRVVQPQGSTDTVIHVQSRSCLRPTRISRPEYTLTATLRTSTDLRAGDGDVGFHDGRNPVAHKIFGPLKNFSDWSVRFTPDRTGPYKVYIGFVDRTEKTDVRRRDAWIEVGQVRLDPPLNSRQAEAQLTRIAPRISPRAKGAAPRCGISPCGVPPPRMAPYVAGTAACGIGSCGVPRTSLGGYVTGTGATRGVPAAGGR